LPTRYFVGSPVARLNQLSLPFALNGIQLEESLSPLVNLLFLQPVSGKAAYDVASNVDEACIVVTSKKEPKATCKIAVTSPLMRTHPFRYYNGYCAMCILGI
jgi:hypothetical protein